MPSSRSSSTAGSPTVDDAVPPWAMVSSTHRVPTSSASGTGGTGVKRSSPASLVSTSSMGSTVTESPAPFRTPWNAVSAAATSSMQPTSVDARSSSTSWSPSSRYVPPNPLQNEVPPTRRPSNSIVPRAWAGMAISSPSNVPDRIPQTPARSSAGSSSSAGGPRSCVAVDQAAAVVVQGRQPVSPRCVELEAAAEHRELVLVLGVRPRAGSPGLGPPVTSRELASRSPVGCQRPESVLQAVVAVNVPSVLEPEGRAVEHRARGLAVEQGLEHPVGAGQLAGGHRRHRAEPQLDVVAGEQQFVAVAGDAWSPRPGRSRRRSPAAMISGSQAISVPPMPSNRRASPSRV